MKLKKENIEKHSISENDRKIILNRLDNYRANPNSATDWIDLKREVFDKFSGIWSMDEFHTFNKNIKDFENVDKEDCK